MTASEQPLAFPPGVDRATFLRDYWQRRPLLMRGALAPSRFPLSPDELAGLSCEPEFESRLIVERESSARELRHGPFDEAEFGALPERRWTLLVQDVDKFVPDVARLIDAFDFVPGWRIDDIMISYASDQGGVGPHTDAYDVFLMQAYGRRRWRLSYREYNDADLIPGLEQRILSTFDTDEEWILEPGDVLYLPPGVAHWGIAEGDCMTYSLGFRAPSQQEIASEWFQHLVGLTDARRLQDPGDLDISSLAELTAGVHRQARQLLDCLPPTDSDEFRIWLGGFLTEPKPQFQILPPDEVWDWAMLDDWLARDADLQRHPFARAAWMTLAGRELALFYQGNCRLLPLELRAVVRLLAERRHMTAAQLTPLLDANQRARLLVIDLLNEGFLEPSEKGQWE